MNVIDSYSSERDASGKPVSTFPHPALAIRTRRNRRSKGNDRCLALPLVKDGLTHLFLLAITSSPPSPERKTLEIPETEAHRAGLKKWKQGWVVIDECNYDIAEQSFYLNAAQAPLGRFSEAFTAQIKDALRSVIQSSAVHRIDRRTES
jgi:hypothetical protein